MKLDPGIGTSLNIGKCYEEWGRIGKALVAYQTALKMAKDDKDKRAPQIQELVDNLDSQVPRLTIKLPKDASQDGVKVTLDGEAITTFGTSLIIDPGPHTIEWTVDDGAKKSRVVPVERGGDSEVTLDIPKERVAKKPPGDGKGKTGGGTKSAGGGDGTGIKPAEATAPAPGRNMRIGGFVLGGAGVIAMGVASIMTLSAKGQYDDALEMHCMGMKNMCDPDGLTATADARSTANTATILFLGGVALVGGGVALYLLAPKGAAQTESRDETARYIVPSVTKDGAGVVFGGRF
ncbi:MAG TPA: tetratricopeptide repeat protein, partial [Kofleriaceae bacterium]|nr:tetratricopeptide repeat protein [Kofleriaceae bacterium]